MYVTYTYYMYSHDVTVEIIYDGAIELKKILVIKNINSFSISNRSEISTFIHECKF